MVLTNASKLAIYKIVSVKLGSIKPFPFDQKCIVHCINFDGPPTVYCTNRGYNISIYNIQLNYRQQLAN